jgi:tetratricopeptide (TPR) repeat protein
MPETTPPRRLDDPLPPSDEQLRAGGLSPAYLKGGALLMRRLMLGAALALRQHRASDAIELQARTADLCGQMQMPKEQVIQLLVLGGYQLAANQPGAARDTYQRAAELAAGEGLALQQAQAELGLGMLDAMAQKPDAMTHYAAAGRLSQQADAVPLAIECFRMTGQCASDHGASERALEHWAHALALSETLSADVRRTTSAADIARLLANAQQARGHHAEANRLHRHAFEIERGAPPHPAPPASLQLPPPGE